MCFGLGTGAGGSPRPRQARGKRGVDRVRAARLRADAAGIVQQRGQVQMQRHRQRFLQCRHRQPRPRLQRHAGMHLAGTGLLHQGGDLRLQRAAAQHQMGAASGQIVAQRGQAVMQPPQRRPSWRPVAGAGLVKHVNRDHLAAGGEAGGQSGLIVQPQIAAQPEQHRSIAFGVSPMRAGSALHFVLAVSLWAELRCPAIRSGSLAGCASIYDHPPIAQGARMRRRPSGITRPAARRSPPRGRPPAPSRGAAWRS